MDIQLSLYLVSIMSALSPDHYELPVRTVALCFPEALLSLSTLYLKIQPLAASMKYLALTLYEEP